MKFYIADCFAEEKYQGNEFLVVIADRFVRQRYLYQKTGGECKTCARRCPKHRLRTVCW